MPGTVFGVPLHPLVVHATVVLVPLAALLVLLAAVWPAARRRIGLWAPVVAIIALFLVPLTTSSGEDLQARVADTALVRAHAEMGDSLIPWAFGLAVAAIALILVSRGPALLARYAGDPDGPRPVRRVPTWLTTAADRFGQPAATPAGGVPAGGVPAGGVPAGGVPAGGVPAGGPGPAATAGSTPAVPGTAAAATGTAPAATGTAPATSTAGAPAGGRNHARWLLPVIVAFAVITSLGTIVQVVRIGHSGAQAAWSKVATTQPTGIRRHRD